MVTLTAMIHHKNMMMMMDGIIMKFQMSYEISNILNIVNIQGLT